MPDTQLQGTWGGDVTRQDIREDDNWFTNTDKTFTFYVTDVNGDPQDITGWAFSWIVKRSKNLGDSSAIFPAKTSGSGVTIIDGQGGVVRASVDAEDTEDLVARVYWHELKRTDTGLKAVVTHGLAVLRKAAHD